MNVNGFCNILFLMVIFSLDSCNSECEEYIIIFVENACSPLSLLTPQKFDEINWDKVTYPCNSTDMYEELFKNKKCILEFDCGGKNLLCKDHVTTKNYSRHISIPGENKTKTYGYKPRVVIPTEIDDYTKKPNFTIEEELDNTTYDVNIIYNNEKEVQASEKSTISDIKCQSVCINEEHRKNYSLDDVENGLNVGKTYHNRSLVINIKRAENSSIQPLFTGYFPGRLNNSRNHNFTKQTEPEFKYFESVFLYCDAFKDYHCKGSKAMSIKQVNVYLKTNYVNNNTITKYPNCAKDFNAMNNTVMLECDAVNFTEHNPHFILRSPLNHTDENNDEAQKNQEIDELDKIMTWNCEIIKVNYSLSAKEQYNDYKVVLFKNCSNNISFKKKSNSSEITPPLGSKTIVVSNTSKDKRTDIPEIKPGISDDEFLNKTKNTITLHITDNSNNCSQNVSFNIEEGIIINIESNNITVNNLVHNKLELEIANCINVTSIVNKTEAVQVEKIEIIMKNGTINATDLKKINEILEKTNDKQKIILECNDSLTSSNNTTNNKTSLRCETMNLDDYKNIMLEERNTDMRLNNTVNPIVEIATEKTKEQKKDNMDEVEDNHNKNKIDTDKKTYNCSKETPDTSRNCANGNTTSANHTKVVVKKDQEDSKDRSNTNPNINRKKDIPNNLEGNNLALDSNEPEKILLITVCSIAGVSILVALLLRKCSKNGEYNVAPTREPPNDEETAF